MRTLSFLLYVPLVWLFHSPVVLLVSVAIAWASVIYPLFELTLWKTGNRVVAYLIVVCFLVMPQNLEVFGDSYYGFHPDQLFLPLFIWAFYFACFSRHFPNNVRPTPPPGHSSTRIPPPSNWKRHRRICVRQQGRRGESWQKRRFGCPIGLLRGV